MVGGLLYLSHTHPDIAFAIGVVSRYMNNTSSQHMEIVKRIMRYVAGIVDHGIMYDHVKEFKLIGHTDSDRVDRLMIERAHPGVIYTWLGCTHLELKE